MNRKIDQLVTGQTTREELIDSPQHVEDNFEIPDSTTPSVSPLTSPQKVSQDAERPPKQPVKPRRKEKRSDSTTVGSGGSKASTGKEKKRYRSLDRYERELGIGDAGAPGAQRA